MNTMDSENMLISSSTAGNAELSCFPLLDSAELPSMFQGQIWMDPWDSDIEKSEGGLRDGA